MAYQQRPARGRGGNQRAQYTRTPPPPPQPPFNGPYYEPSARGRGGNQRAQYTRTPPPPPPPPFNGPYYEPSARGLARYQQDVGAGVVIGAVGAAASMFGYDVPNPNLPPTTGFVAYAIEEFAKEEFDGE